MKKSHTWRRDGNIRSWLYRIQYTVFLNHYARANPVEIAAQPAIDMTGGHEGQQAQETRLNGRRVLEAAHQLAPAHRDVLLLVAAQGCSYDETARIMDLPVGTVRSRLARARAELRAILGDTEQDKKSRYYGKEES
jgi:RNA polymerase sigma-70 factor (ECF subfamily)